MSNLEIIKTLLNVMDCSSVTDEGIKKVCLDLLEREIGGAKPKPAIKQVETKPPAKKAPQKRKPFDTGKAVACRRAGWSVAKIADEMQCTEQTVRNNLKKAGIT